MNRFWSKVNKGTEDECWEWQAGKNNKGYGAFKFGGSTIGAHRFSYLLARGSIPVGMQVCHHCDNPGCVNPKHLFVGTQSDNQQDSVAKGRDNPPWGEKCGKAKLCNGDVYEIRRLYSLGVTQVLLAKMWIVSVWAIADIVNRNTWKHIGVANELL